MARATKRQSTSSAKKTNYRDKDVPSSSNYCSANPAIERPLAAAVHRDRAMLIRPVRTKWVNGTTLHYFFFNSPARWRLSEVERNVVRKAFDNWKALGTGLDFVEVDNASEAELRIGGLRGDGAWSYIGRDALEFGPDKRTMNFGWDISQPGEIDTAMHEIGHALGFPHEHQNPKAGIVWNEEAVYRSLAAPPNNWDRATTFSNIISKLNPDTLQGSKWDPDSIMHYPFEPGMILAPPPYEHGLTPRPGLSTRDKQWMKQFYPPLRPADELLLKPLRAIPLSINPGQQINLLIKPTMTRKYTIGTFGDSDSVMVLFENVDGEFRYMSADDDSGEDRNARIRIRLRKGQMYRLRVRLYYSFAAGETAVMMW